MIFHVAVRSYSITFDQVAQKGIMQIFRNQTIKHMHGSAYAQIHNIWPIEIDLKFAKT
jgi:hypothetical protein